MTVSDDTERTRRLIGRRVRLDGLVWQVVEYLEDSGALVLQCTDQRTIQGNRHGDAHRRVPRTRVIDPADHPTLVAELHAQVESPSQPD